MKKGLGIIWSDERKVELLGSVVLGLSFAITLFGVWLLPLKLLVVVMGIGFVIWVFFRN